MKTDGYQRFQDLILQEIQAQKEMATQAAVKEFVQYANTRGFTIDRLIQMAESGMSGADISNTVHSS